MYSTIKYTETKDLLTIDISQNIKPIVTFGFVLQGLLYTIFLPVLLLYFLFTNLTGYKFSDLSLWVFIAIIIILIIILFVVGKAYLKKVFAKEKIKVTKFKLTLAVTELLSTKLKAYDIEKIAHFSYSGRENFTKHPLAKAQYDLTGLGAGESELQYLIEQGTFTFFYEGASIQFGKNIPSEDAEEMIRRIEKFTDNNLSLDDKTELMIKKLT